jgi:hypothetical protein
MSARMFYAGGQDDPICHSHLSCSSDGGRNRLNVINKKTISVSISAALDTGQLAVR